MVLVDSIWFDSLYGRIKLVIVDDCEGDSRCSVAFALSIWTSEISSTVERQGYIGLEQRMIPDIIPVGYDFKLSISRWGLYYWTDLIILLDVSDDKPVIASKVLVLAIGASASEMVIEVQP